MLNYEHKNLKSVLTNTDQIVVLTKNSETIETIIIGGQVCNKNPDLAALFTMILYNSYNKNSTYIYKDIKIEPTDYLSIGKINLDEYQSIIVSVSFEDSEEELSDVNLTLNYFEIYDYDYGFVRIFFEEIYIQDQKPVTPINYFPKWKFTNENIWHDPEEYVISESGNRIVEFLEIVGYSKPDNVELEIIPMKIVEITLSYDYMYPIINFKCNQIDARENFGWRLADSESEEYYENEKYVMIPDGNYEIEFKNIINFIKPPNKNYTFEQNYLYKFS
jgi:hypothetical protein